MDIINHLELYDITVDEYNKVTRLFPYCQFYIFTIINNSTMYTFMHKIEMLLPYNKVPTERFVE